MKLSHARVVVIGGGSLGVSLLYHLTQEGWTDIALIEKGRIVGFEGDEREVSKIRAHYDFVAKRYAIDSGIIHSWHAGIHPQNGYLGRAADNLARWGRTAFGNPRYLHFHTCGNYAPGEICVSVFDPTISVDGVDMWRNGTLEFANTPTAKKLLAEYPGMQEMFDQPVMEYGLGDA